MLILTLTLLWLADRVEQAVNYRGAAVQQGGEGCRGRAARGLASRSGVV
jgi:hypothetical protein